MAIKREAGVGGAGLAADPEAGEQLRALMVAAFEGFAGGDAHPCLGARSVIRRHAYELHVYPRLGSVAAAAGLADDLERFGRTVEPGQLSSFVAVFVEPAAVDQDRFTDLLWHQLQQLHDIDRRRHGWDPAVSSDPDDPNFSFSAGGRAYFVVGLHAAASRWARRFGWPTLVFNPHEQFVALRTAQRYERMSSLIRGRDVDLQGTWNPSLSEHGTRSEARQYSGQELPETWRCPLIVRARG